jgi:hypothetical protein
MLTQEDPASVTRSSPNLSRVRVVKCKTTMVKAIKAILMFLALLSHVVVGGPIAYGLCQTGCNGLAVACYASAGFVFGTVTAGAGTPAVIVGCNAALGFCMASCIAAAFAPTP